MTYEQLMALIELTRADYGYPEPGTDKFEKMSIVIVGLIDRFNGKD